ncbi:hypothetical protein SLE2022_102770 [Rubroshorea leprosula]
MALTKAQLDGVARSNKVRCPPERSQNKGRIMSSVLKKAKDVVCERKKARLPPKRGRVIIMVLESLSKSVVVCERKKARLPPKRGRVIIMVLESLSKSVAKLPSKSWNLLNRKNNCIRGKVASTT